MSSFNLDARERSREFASYLKGLEDRLAALERTNQLNNASIEGGALDIFDSEGTLKATVGIQPDGTVALVPDPVNTDPPPTPTAPAVEPALAGLVIGWDGRWADAETIPADFSLVQVHVGTTEAFTPTLATQIATITAPLGGTVTVHVEGYAAVWVRLVAQNTASLTGDPSTAVQGLPRQAVSQDLIDGIITDVKLAEEAVTAAKLAAQAVTTDKVAPGAINDLLLADDAVTAAKLATGAVSSTALADGAVLSEKLAANAVTQAKLANGAVTDLQLANSAVTAAKVAALAIDSTKIADAAVTAAKIGAAAVTAGKLAAQSVTSTALTAALADTVSQRWVDVMSDPSQWTVTQSGTGASWSHVTASDASSGTTVGQAAGFIRIRGNTLIPYDPDALYRFALRVRATAQPTTADVIYFGALGIAADGVTLVSRDGTNSANSAHYFGASAKAVATADGWVNVIGFAKGRALVGASGSAGPNNDPRSPGTVHSSVRFVVPYIWLNYNNQSSVAGTMQVDAVTVEALKTGVVDSINLVAGSVTTAAIAADAVTATQIAANAVTAAEISSGAVIAGKIAAGAVTATEIAANTITSGQLAANSVTATAIAAGQVQTAALAANAVAAGKIDADAVTVRELAANAVTAAKISANAVTATAIAAGSVTTDKLTVVGGSNVLADPSFEGPGGAAIAAKQTFLSIDAAFGNGSPSSIKIDAASGTAAYRSAELTLLPVTAGDQLYVAADYYPSTTWVGTEIDLQVRWEKADGTVLSYSKFTTTTPVKGAWARHSGTATAPTDAMYARIRVESGNATAGAVWWDNAVVRPVVPGVQIADGAITTPKMVANTINGDRISAGTLDAAKITAGTITTSQLNVTSAASILQKFYDVGSDAARWRQGGTSVSTATVITNLTTASVSDAQAGGSVMRAVAGVVGAWRPDALIPFDPNVLYRVSFVVRQTVAGSNTAQQQVFLGVAGVAADGVTLVNSTGAAAVSSQHYVAASAQNLTAGGGWQRFTGYIKGAAASGVNGTSTPAATPTSPALMHASVRYLSPLFYANYNAGTGTTEISSVTIEVVETGAVQTVNIQDGAITTAKMVANTIQGDRIAAGTLNADRIVGNSITASQLAALSVTAAQLAANSVTASAILAGTIDATHIKAGAITADRLAITGGSNMLPDPSFEGAGGAALVAGQTFWSIVNTGNNSAKSVQVNAVNGSTVIRTLTLATFPILPGQQLRIATDVNPSTDWNGSSVRIYARWIDSAGGVTFGFVTNTTPTKGAWQTIAGTVTAPAGTVSVEIRLASYDASAGTVTFDNSLIMPVMADVLIADGAITAAKLDAAAINGKVITGATVQTAASGKRVVLPPDGNVYFYTGDVNESAPGKIIADGGSYPSLLILGPTRTGSSQGTGITMFTGPDGTAQHTIGQVVIQRTAAGNDSISFLGGTINTGTVVADKVTATNIKTGRVTITPSAANTPTSVTVTGLGLTGSNPRALATASTQVPGTQVTGVGCSDLTTSAVTIWLTRTNTTATSVDYFVMAS